MIVCKSKMMYAVRANLRLGVIALPDIQIIVCFDDKCWTEDELYFLEERVNLQIALHKPASQSSRLHCEHNQLSLIPTAKT